MKNKIINKSIVTVSCDYDVVNSARARGVNISQAAEHGIAMACEYVYPEIITPNPLEELKKLKPVILEKLNRDLAVFDRTGEISRISRWERNIKKIAGVKVSIADMRAATEHLPPPGAPKIKSAFCKTCDAVTEHEVKRMTRGGRASEVRICRACKTYV